MQWAKSLVWVILDFVQKWKVKVKNNITCPISLRVGIFFLYMLNMKQAGVFCCTYFASGRKNEDYILWRKKPQTFGCPPVPASGRNVFVLA